MLSPLCAKRVALSRKACQSPAAQCGPVAEPGLWGRVCMDVRVANYEAHLAAGPLLSPVQLQLIYKEADTVSTTSS